MVYPNWRPASQANSPKVQVDSYFQLAKSSAHGRTPSMINPQIVICGVCASSQSVKILTIRSCPQLTQGPPQPILGVSRLLQPEGEQRTDIGLRGRAPGGGQEGIPARSDFDVGRQAGI